MDNGSQHVSEASIVSLLSGIAKDAEGLLLQEVALTKLEVPGAWLHVILIRRFVSVL